VLSGFLITGILLDSINSPQYFTSFYARRALRIFPLYYAALLLYFHVAVPVAHAAGYWPEITSSGQGWFWAYLINWRAAAGHEYKNISHFWSLAVEEQFYLFWPAVVFVSGRYLRWICVGMSGVALVLRAVLMNRDLAWVFATPLRVDALAAGALVAILIRDHRIVPQLKRSVVPVAVSSCALLAAILFLARGAPWPTDYRAPYVRTWGLTLLSLIFACVVTHCGIRSGSNDGFCKLMRTRALAFLGKYSYAIYVLHLWITYYCLRTEKLILQRIGPAWTVALAFAAVAATLSVSLGAALLSWTLIEKRFLAMKRYFPYFEPGRESARQTRGQAAYLTVTTPSAPG